MSKLFLCFVRIGIAKDEGILEIETEDDGSLSLCNIAELFPNISGLKYFNTNTNFWRGVRRVGESFFPPKAKQGWGDTVYVVVLTPGGKCYNGFCF